MIFGRIIPKTLEQSETKWNCISSNLLISVLCLNMCQILLAEVEVNVLKIAPRRIWRVYIIKIGIYFRRPDWKTKSW